MWTTLISSVRLRRHKRWVANTIYISLHVIYIRNGSLRQLRASAAKGQVRERVIAIVADGVISCKQNHFQAPTGSMSIRFPVIHPLSAYDWYTFGKKKKKLLDIMDLFISVTGARYYTARPDIRNDGSLDDTDTLMAERLWPSWEESNRMRREFQTQPPRAININRRETLSPGERHLSGVQNPNDLSSRSVSSSAYCSLSFYYQKKEKWFYSISRARRRRHLWRRQTKKKNTTKPRRAAHKRITMTLGFRRESIYNSCIHRAGERESGTHLITSNKNLSSSTKSCRPG